MSYILKELFKMYPDEKTVAGRTLRGQKDLLELSRNGDEDAFRKLLKLEQCCQFTGSFSEKDVADWSGGRYKDYKWLKKLPHIKYDSREPRYAKCKNKKPFTPLTIELKYCHDHGEPPPIDDSHGGPTVTQCIYYYLEQHEMPERRKREYEYLVQPRGIAEPIKDRVVSGLRTRDYIIITTIGQNNDLSNNTINYKVKFLFDILVWAKDQKLVDRLPPWDDIPPLRTRWHWRTSCGDPATWQKRKQQKQRQIKMERNKEHEL